MGTAHPGLVALGEVSRIEQDDQPADVPAHPRKKWWQLWK